MESEDDHLYRIIMNAGIDVNLHSLHNPTEAFMVNIVTEYFKRFNFDGDEIAKPTPEQLSCVSCEEAVLDALQAINLHAALTKICDEIFLKDFTLTDITNPGYKRTIKKIKVLFNFYLYVENKKNEKQHLFYELENRQQEIETMIQKKEDLTAQTGSFIHEREKKLERKEDLIKEIEQLQAAMKKNSKNSQSLQRHIDEIKFEHQQYFKKVNDFKAKIQELHKITKDLQSNIVTSPEEYISRKEELENLMKQKKEERHILHQSINSKKSQIEKHGSSESIIQECYAKANDAMEISKELKEIIAKLVTTKKKITELNEEIVSLERRPSNTRDSNLPGNLDLEENQQLLTVLHVKQAENERESEVLKKKREVLQNEVRNLKSRLQKEKEAIVVGERNYATLLHEYKSYFNNTISEEYTFRKDLEIFANNRRR